jgi:hypothetical protein
MERVAAELDARIAARPEAWLGLFAPTARDSLRSREGSR